MLSREYSLVCIRKFEPELPRFDAGKQAEEEFKHICASHDRRFLYLRSVSDSVSVTVCGEGSDNCNVKSRSVLRLADLRVDQLLWALVPAHIEALCRRMDFSSNEKL